MRQRYIHYMQLNLASAQKTSLIILDPETYGLMEVV